MSTSNINIEISSDEIEELFRNVLTGPHKNLIAEIVIGHLGYQGGLGLTHLFRAIHGIDNKLLEWAVGMEVYVKENCIYSARKDIDTMKKLGLVYQNEYIKAIITGIDIYNSYSIKLDLITVDVSGKFDTSSHTVKPYYIIRSEEWP